MNLVTVCITTYNRKEFLPMALSSILNQDYNNLEVIIVDDCSTDGTEKLVTDKLLRQDDRIKYIRHSQNMGLAASRNTAILNSTGTYFSFCDDDDKWEKGFIKHFVKVSSKFDDSWCFCCATKTTNGVSRPFKSKKTSLKKAILEGFTPPVASQFYFTSTLRKIGGYNEKIKSGVDHDLWLKLAKHNNYILFSNQCYAIPDAYSLSHDKLTTNFDKRLSGILSSLEVWRQDVCELYGDDFYKHFYAEYMKHIVRKIIIKSVKEINFKVLYQILKKERTKKYFFPALFSIFSLLLEKSETRNTFKPYVYQVKK